MPLDVYRRKVIPIDPYDDDGSGVLISFEEDNKEGFMMDQIIEDIFSEAGFDFDINAITYYTYEELSTILPYIKKKLKFYESWDIEVHNGNNRLDVIEWFQRFIVILEDTISLREVLIFAGD